MSNIVILLNLINLLNFITFIIIHTGANIFTDSFCD